MLSHISLQINDLSLCNRVLFNSSLLSQHILMFYFFTVYTFYSLYRDYRDGATSIFMSHIKSHYIVFRRELF